MAINLKAPETKELRPRITVLGVGGAGGNAVNNMIEAGLEGVEFIVANTDAQALAQSKCGRRIQMGVTTTEGLGAGAQPDMGRAGAEESMNEIMENLAGSHMVFIAAGMGGGTGTGAAPVIARAVREAGILTVGVVTKPFSLEGDRRMRVAERGIAELQQFVHTLIIIPNQNLFRVANDRTTMAQAFAMADEVLHAGVRGVTDLIVMPGLINLDFADIKSVISEMGKAMMGTGEAEGDNRAIHAAEKAIANPLLDGVSMKGAKGVIISITGGDDMRLLEVDEAANHIRELVDPDANIIWGSAFNNDLEGKIRVSVVATGIEAEISSAAEPARVFSFPNARKIDETPPAAPTVRYDAPSFAPVREQAVEKAAAPAPAPAPAPQPEPLVLEAPEPPTVVTPAPARVLRFEDDAVAGQPVPGELTLDTPAGPGELLLDGSEIQPPPEVVIAEDEELPSDRGFIKPRTVPPAPRIGGGGGTLFERMSNITRSSARTPGPEADANADPLDIPRFLNRQNNQ